MRQELTETLITHKHGLRRRLGFTLVEVVVASGLLVAAIVPILSALTTAYVTSAKIEQKTNSLMYAQSKLDEIRSKSIYNYSSTFAVTNLSLGGSYICNVTDTPVSSSLRTITVQVGYDTDGNNTLSSSEVQVTLSTLIAQRY